MPLELSTYALASLDQTKRACGVATAVSPALPTDVNDNLIEAIEGAGAQIEDYLERKLVTRGAITEYHSPVLERTAIYLTQFPTISITTVDEGAWSGGAWASSATLVAGTDYLVDGGRMLRLSSGALGAWPSGFESVRVVYTGGYANTAGVPDLIRRVALQLAARRFAEIRRGQPGAQTITDAMGSLTRFLPSELLKMEREALSSERRYYTTGRAA